jgi:Tol biopolymer transport system component
LFNTTGSRGDLFAIPTNGDTTKVPLSVGIGGNNVFGQVSPSGRWVAYTSDESGNLQVYVRPFPEAAGAKALVSRESGFGAKWSADGSEIFYLTLRGELMVAKVTSGEAFSSSPPVRLFERSDLGEWSVGFGVHPDGQRFLVAAKANQTDARSAAGAEPQLVIVENFFKVLRERAGR